MFGISGGEFLVLLVVGALVLGPRNIAQALRAVRNVIESVRDWSSRLRAESDEGELGLTEADIATLKSLDLRQLDPRRIVREAVREEMDAWMAVAGTATGAVGAGETTAYSSGAFARTSSAMPDQDTSTPGRVDVSDPAASGPGHIENVHPDDSYSACVATSTPSKKTTQSAVAQAEGAKPPSADPLSAESSSADPLSAAKPNTSAPNAATPHVPRRRTLQDQAPKTLESSLEPTAPQTSIKGDHL